MYTQYTARRRMRQWPNHRKREEPQPLPVGSHQPMSAVSTLAGSSCMIMIRPVII